MAERNKRRLLRHLRKVSPTAWLGSGALALIGAAALVAMRFGWNPREPFHRNAPEVERAKASLTAGRHDEARQTLGDYLGTGPCTEDGALALSDKVRARPDASYDLGLALFQLAEASGAPFGAADVPQADGKEPELDPKRKAAIECARIVALAVASDADVDAGIRARASFLVGNLEFLRSAYEEAVKHYDRALELVPAIGDKAPGDPIGRDVARNRAIALRRIEEKKKRDEENKKQEEQDQPKDQDQKKDDQDDQNDQPKDQDQKKDDQDDQPKDQDQKKDDQNDQPKDQDRKKDQQEPRAENEPKPSKPDEPPDGPEDAPQAKAPPSSRMLDDLREAPTYQEENAKRDAARVRRAATMEDK